MGQNHGRGLAGLGEGSLKGDQREPDEALLAGRRPCQRALVRRLQESPLVLAQELPGEGKGALIRGPFFGHGPIDYMPPFRRKVPVRGQADGLSSQELTCGTLCHTGHPLWPKRGPKGLKKGPKRASKGLPWELPEGSLGHHVWPGSSHEHHRCSQEPPMAPHGSPGASQRLPRGPKRAPWELPGSSLGDRGEALGSQGEALGTFPGGAM